MLCAHLQPAALVFIERVKAAVIGASSEEEAQYLVILGTEGIVDSDRGTGPAKRASAAGGSSARSKGAAKRAPEASDARQLYDLLYGSGQSRSAPDSGNLVVGNVLKQLDCDTAVSISDDFTQPRPGLNIVEIDLPTGPQGNKSSLQNDVYRTGVDAVLQSAPPGTIVHVLAPSRRALVATFPGAGLFDTDGCYGAHPEQPVLLNLKGRGVNLLPIPSRYRFASQAFCRVPTWAAHQTRLAAQHVLARVFRFGLSVLCGLGLPFALNLVPHLSLALYEPAAILDGVEMRFRAHFQSLGWSWAEVSEATKLALVKIKWKGDLHQSLPFPALKPATFVLTPAPSSFARRRGSLDGHSASAKRNGGLERPRPAAAARATVRHRRRRPALPPPRRHQRERKAYLENGRFQVQTLRLPHRGQSAVPLPGQLPFRCVPQPERRRGGSTRREHDHACPALCAGRVPRRRPSQGYH
jgi:hypothetical protein